jgi:hypothetical protein
MLGTDIPDRGFIYFLVLAVSTSLFIHIKKEKDLQLNRLNYSVS